MQHDAECREIIVKHPGAMISWYLMASYVYYILNDESLLSDGLYDELSEKILEKYDELEHIHKHLITKEDLRAGTLYGLRDNEYPTMVKGAVSRFRHVNFKMQKIREKLQEEPEGLEAFM